MKIKNTTIFAALSFFMILSSTPIFASGSKDTDSPTKEQNKAVLRVVNRPFGFGEGGGAGAGLRPEGFEEIDSSILDGSDSPTVVAEMITLTGTLKVSGSKGKRKFTFKSDEGKSYALKVPAESAEDYVKYKGKKIKIQGVFYDSDFLVFSFKTIE